jgi:hypothetical protein
VWVWARTRVDFEEPRYADNISACLRYWKPVFVYEIEKRWTGNLPKRRNTCEHATFLATFFGNGEQLALQVKGRWLFVQFCCITQSPIRVILLFANFLPQRRLGSILYNTLIFRFTSLSSNCWKTFQLCFMFVILTVAILFLLYHEICVLGCGFCFLLFLYQGSTIPITRSAQQDECYSIGCSERRLIGHWLTGVIKDTEQSTKEASVTLDGVTLTDLRPSVCREIPMSADKMFWTSNKPAQWTLCIIVPLCISRW